MDECEPPALDDFLLLKILDVEELSVSLLLALRTKGSRLRTIVDAILLSRFLDRWNLSAVDTPPPSPAAFTCALRHFVQCHTLSPSDSLSSIAIRYGTNTASLRRLNNIISDHTLASRTEIYVPVTNKEQLEGCRVEFHFNSAAHGRPMWVVLPPRDPAAEHAAPSQPLPEKSGISARLLEMFQKALGVDAPTARYYLLSTGGDVRAAMAAYKDDQRWDKCMRHLRKSLVKAGGGRR